MSPASQSLPSTSFVLGSNACTTEKVTASGHSDKAVVCTERRPRPRETLQLQNSCLISTLQRWRWLKRSSTDNDLNRFAMHQTSCLIRPAQCREQQRSSSILFYLCCKLRNWNSGGTASMLLIIQWSKLSLGCFQQREIGFSYLMLL